MATNNSFIPFDTYFRIIEFNTCYVFVYFTIIMNNFLNIS